MKELGKMTKEKVTVLRNTKMGSLLASLLKIKNMDKELGFILMPKEHANLQVLGLMIWDTESSTFIFLTKLLKKDNTLTIDKST